MSSRRVPVTVFRDGKKHVIGEADVFDDGTITVELNTHLKNTINTINGVCLGLSVGPYIVNSQ